MSVSPIVCLRSRSRSRLAMIAAELLPGLEVALGLVAELELECFCCCFCFGCGILALPRITRPQMLRRVAAADKALSPSGSGKWWGAR